MRLNKNAAELFALTAHKGSTFIKTIEQVKEENYTAAFDEVHNPKLKRVIEALHDLSLGNKTRIGLIDFYALAEESNRLRNFSPPTVVGGKDEFNLLTVQAIRDFGKDLAGILRDFPKLVESVFTGQTTGQAQGPNR